MSSGEGTPPGRVDTVLPWDHRPRCACEEPELSQVLGTPDLVVLACARCRGLLCGEPAGDAGLRLLTLDAEAEALVWRAIELDPQAPLPARLQGALACAAEPVAARVAAAKLWGQEGFADELCPYVRSDDAGERLLALDLISRTPQVPAPVAGAVVDALRNPLDPSPLSDEAALVLGAAYNVASAAWGFRDVVARLGEAAAEAGGERGELVRKLADAVLGRMDEHRRQAMAAFRAEHEQIQERVLAGDLAGAEQRLQELVDDPCHDTAAASRGALCEAAGDALAVHHPGHARWLYHRAAELFRAYASGATSGGEGMSRMLDVQRVIRKLGGRGA